MIRILSQLLFETHGIGSSGVIPLDTLFKYYFAIMKEENPVILKLEGGLGNQLFQLAAGYYLAAKTKSNLLIDQYSIPLTTAHGESRFGFSEFYIDQLSSGTKIVVLKSLPSKLLVKWAKSNPNVKKFLLKIRMHTSNPQKLSHFFELNEVSSKSDFFNINSSVKLHGNFQSWEIVEKAAQFGFPRVLQLRDTPQWISEFVKVIDFKNSIVLHFRVGDDAGSNASFKQPEINYYLEALKLINSKRNFTKTFILSDDISRVRDMFGSKLDRDFQYLEMPAESSPAERLYVLSLFGGIVCANSTFCGWAAWSISNSGGEVVVPIPYSDGQVLGSRDFPPNWVKLDKYSGAESA